MSQSSSYSSPKSSARNSQFFLNEFSPPFSSCSALPCRAFACRRHFRAATPALRLLAPTFAISWPAGIKSDVDLRPTYVLNWLPAAGTSTIIKVRLRYLYKGEEFGNWTPWQNWTLPGD